MKKGVPNPDFRTVLVGGSNFPETIIQLCVASKGVSFLDMQRLLSFDYTSLRRCTGNISDQVLPASLNLQIILSTYSQISTPAQIIHGFLSESSFLFLPNSDLICSLTNITIF